MFDIEQRLRHHTYWEDFDCNIYINTTEGDGFEV